MAIPHPLIFQLEVALALFVGVAGILTALKAAWRARGWQQTVRVLAFALGIIFVILGAASVQAHTVWFGGLYILFGAIEIVAFARLDTPALFSPTSCARPC